MRRLAPIASALVLAVTMAAPAQAEPPPPEYFTGVYERIGRSGGEDPTLLNDLWRIDPSGSELRLTPCRGKAPARLLRFDRFGDLDNLLSGPDGLWCQFFNDGGNYALLSCGAEDGLAVQFRVVTDSREAGCPAP